MTRKNMVLGTVAGIALAAYVTGASAQDDDTLKIGLLAT